MRYSRVLIIPAVALLLLALLSPVASADQGEIVVVSEDVASQFPNGISFSVSLQSSSPIDEVRVFYRSEEAYTTTYGHLEFEPGQQIHAHYLLSTGGDGASGAFVPPGATFLYSFEIRDEAGNVLRTPQKEFVYLDPRFEWATISEGPITVYHYGPTEKRAETILQSSLQAVTNMSRVLGVEAVEPINIVAYNNYRHMVLALPPRSQAVREGLVTEGQAFTDIRVLLVLAFVENIQGVASHEVTHILIDDASGQGYPIMPLWLNEGLAELGNIDPTETYDNALLYGIYTRRLKPLWHLSTFSGDPDDIVIAYGQSRSVVSYLVNVYGEEKMAQFMEELGNTLSVDQAMSRVYGFDQQGLDAEWRTRIGLSPLPEGEAPSTPTASSAPSIRETQDAPSTHTPMPREEKEPEASSPGCNRGSRSSAAAATDPLVLLLLAGPMGMLSWRRLRKPRA